MNETDVREAIVRPLLITLGWARGTYADILTEYPLTYGHYFLGHQKASDPVIRGKADYVCQLVGLTRWTVEVKRGNHKLTIKDVHQAHSYAAHPEVAAPLFLLTNGTEFKLYQLGVLEKPALEWTVHEIDDRMSEIAAQLSPLAVERRFNALRINRNVEIGTGLSTHAKIAGGAITYREFFAKSPKTLDVLKAREGTRSFIREGLANRADDGRLHVKILVRQGDAKYDVLAKLMNLECFSFDSIDKQISIDRENPTIFTGQSRGLMQAGTDVSMIPGVALAQAPYTVSFSTSIRITAFLDRDTVKGTFTYSTTFSVDTSLIAREFWPLVERALQDGEMSSAGDFELVLVPAGLAEVERIRAVLLDAAQIIY